jgi:phosphoribosylanthranilate isomerase
MVPKIKICCISSIEEANLAIAQGAAALGLVGKMPSGPGIISDELIYTIAKGVPTNIDTFMLTSETIAEAIIEHHKKTNTSTIQIVDALSEGTYAQIKKALPSIKIVQVIHILNEASIEEALRISEQVDALLLDSGNPNLQTKELGGTGRVHNWNLSRKIVEQSKRPVYLAGGINPMNIKQAVEEVQPYGIDLCSGVRTNKLLDPIKLEQLFNAIH